MEALNAGLRRAGTDFDCLRVGTHPTGSQAVKRNTNAFDDTIGSSFGNNAPKSKKTYTSNAKKSRLQRPDIRDQGHDSFDSDDPISLSEATENSSPVKPKKAAAYVDSDGRSHTYHEDYHPERSNALKKLKFKRTSSATTLERGESSWLVGNRLKVKTLDSVQQKATVKPKAIGYASSVGHIKTKGSPKEQDIRPTSPNPSGSSQPSRPRPRPVVKAGPSKPQPFPLDMTSSQISSNIKRRRTYTIDSDSESSAADDSSTKERKPLQQFPLKDMELLEESKTSPSPSNNTNTKPAPAPFPMSVSKDSPLSPYTEKPKKKHGSVVLKPFPMGSPQRKDKTFITEKGKRRDESLCSAAQESPPRHKPFPMSTQLHFNSSPTSSPEVGASTDRKRHSGNATNDEDPTPRKKPRESFGAQLLQDDGFEEDNSLFISPDVDPKTLCPYCDARLPTSPSPLLVRLLKTAERNSTRDPRPTNPIGRRAPFTRYIAVCQRHRFESQVLPDAEQKGWPKMIDWQQLGRRVGKMKVILQGIIMDAEDGVEIVEIDGNTSDSMGTGARSQSVFWREVMNVIKKKGSKAATGVKDQFLNFEKTQPGYYGELGSMIIHQTLYDMFPPSSFDVESIAPLSAEELIQRVLVPEVALRLIMEDRGLAGDAGKKAALGILRESSAYGVAMFPEDAGEEAGEPSRTKKKNEEGLAAGERIVMERAKKRRKEIEEEEEKEKEELRVEEEKQAHLAASASEGDMYVSETVARPRPRPVGKAGSKSSVMQMSSGRDQGRKSNYATDADCKSSVYGDTDSDASDARSSINQDNEPPRVRQTRSRSLSVSEINAADPPPKAQKPRPRAKSRSVSKQLVSDTDSGLRKPPPKRVVRTNGKKNTSDMDISAISSSDSDGSEAPSTKTPKPKTRYRTESREPSVIEILDDSHATPKPQAKIREPLIEVDPLAQARLQLKKTREAKAGASAVQKGPKADARRFGEDGWLQNFRQYAESSDSDWLLEDVPSQTAQASLASQDNPLVRNGKRQPGMGRRDSRR